MTSTLVTRLVQTNRGIRNIVMPGARSVTIVAAKLTAPRIVPRPDTARPAIHRFAPAPGEFTASDSGASAYQPKSAAAAGGRKPDTARVLRKRNSQKEKAFSRGNATSGEPICS